MKKIRKNFTLIEILAAAAIVAILAIIGFGSYNYAMGKSKEAASRALVKQLETGFETFKSKYGYYPSSGGDYVNLYLTVDPSSNEFRLMECKPETGSKVVLMGHDGTPSLTKEKLKAEQLKTFLRNIEPETLRKYLGADGIIEDAWGGPLAYRAPGKINTGSFDLISAGADDLFGDGGTLNASQKKLPVSTGTREAALEKYKDAASGEWICDDIANF